MPKRHDGGSNLSQDLWAEGPETEVLGTLAIPSGKVVVCDAGVLDSRVVVDVPRGDYVVRIQTDGEGTNVAATLIRAGAIPVAFEEEAAARARRRIRPVRGRDVLGVSLRRWRRGLPRVRRQGRERLCRRGRDDVLSRRSRYSLA